MLNEENVQRVNRQSESTQSEARHWRFTINFAGNDGRDKREECIGILNEQFTTAEREGTIIYAIMGREMGESGTHHIQGHVYFSKKKRFMAAKTLIDRRAWLATARFPKESVEYCKKDGEFIEIGKWTSNQGKRNDLAGARELLDTGCSIKEFQEAYFDVWVKYPSGIQGYMKAHAKKRVLEEPLEVHWYWGKAGTGKTHKVHELEEAFERPENLWIAMDNTFKWFDGYDGHEAVLFDDFDHIDTEHLSVFKKCLDKYNYRVQVKGGSVAWVPLRIYFTSNRSLEEVIEDLQECHHEAIRRRFTKIIEFTNLQ